uniref:T-complex protein 11-like protein 2 n=1 Tax=Anoplopoma fimbria TaxID=229290 RepID=C3KIE6_ANOFI|nr:T-complex protein 11-like protein 2 [Anoplopoma fimbria]
MPLNDERPASTSSSEEQGSDVESSSERCDSMTSTSDLDCSRESFTSDCSSKQCTPSSSPPKTITLDEVMESGRDLSNLSIAHEIIVNRNFHLEPDSLPQDSLWKIVRDNVHKAFWDILDKVYEGQVEVTGQICSITQKDNPIRTLVEDRVQQFFTALICDPKPQVKVEQVPTGLTAIKPELALMGAKFISLVNYNKTVYGPFYADIIRKLMFSSSLPAANPQQDTVQDSVTSN